MMESKEQEEPFFTSPRGVNLEPIEDMRSKFQAQLEYNFRSSRSMNSALVVKLPCISRALISRPDRLMEDVNHDDSKAC